MNPVIVKLLIKLFDQEPSAKDIREFRRIQKDFEKMLEVTSKIQEALSPPTSIAPPQSLHRYPMISSPGVLPYS